MGLFNCHVREYSYIKIATDSYENLQVSCGNGGRGFDILRRHSLRPDHIKNIYVGRG